LNQYVNQDGLVVLSRFSYLCVMKSFALILVLYFFTCQFISGEIGDGFQAVKNLNNEGDTIVLFEENFSDSNFTTNPAWLPTIVQMCAPQPATIAIVNGVLKIQQQDARTCGNWAHLSMELNIPVSDSTKFQFDVKPAYSSVDDGAGWKNDEYPVSVRLKLVNQKDEFMDIWFCYNYRGGASYLYKDQIRLVFPYCDQDEWVRNEVYRIKDFFPDAKTIIELRIAGSGWDYEGYADNIKIYNNIENVENKTYNEIIMDPFDPDTISKSRHEKAIEGYKENLRLARFGNDTLAQAMWMLSIGDGYFQLNEFESAIVYLNQTVDVCKQISIHHPRRNTYQAKSYFLLSRVFSLRNQYVIAQNILDELYDLYQSVNDTAGIIQALNEKAGIYNLSGNTILAEESFYKILNLSLETENSFITAKTYQKLGDLYLLDSLYTKALNNYLNALDIYKKVGDLNSTATLFFDIGNVYFMMKESGDAIDNLKKSLEIAKMRNLESLLGDIYLKLSEVYDDNGDKEIALSYFKLYSKTRTILFDKEKNQVLAEQYVKYESERKDQQINILKKDNEIQEFSIREKSNQLYFTIAFGVLVFILLMIIYSRYRTKQKANETLLEKNALITQQKQEIEQQVKEKETMLRELHHRVKNNLQTIYSMLSIQSRKLKDPDAIAIIKPNIDRVWAMALIHHKLYRDEKLTSINISKYVNELVENVLRTNWAGEKEIKVNKEIEIEYLEADVAIPLGLLINELMVNTVKHAFKRVKNPEFNISIKEGNTKELIMVIKDNGPGIPEKFITDHSDSFGLELINLLVTQLKGKMEITNNKGACFTFILKH